MNTDPLRQTVDLQRLREARQQIPPWLRRQIAGAIAEYEAEIGRYKEALEDASETRDRLRVLQHVLIALLQQQGGSVTLESGALAAVPGGSVVGVEKLDRGEADRVRLRIYWRPPGGAPAALDYEPDR